MTLIWDTGEKIYRTSPNNRSNIVTPNQTCADMSKFVSFIQNIFQILKHIPAMEVYLFQIYYKATTSPAGYFPYRSSSDSTDRPLDTAEN